MSASRTIADHVSFVVKNKGRGTGFRWWVVRPTGDYGRDCETGERFALEYLAYCEAHPESVALAGIVKEMPAKLTGIETAFLQTIGCAATAGAFRARQVAASHQRMRVKEISDVNEWTAQEFRRGEMSADDIVAEAAKRLEALS